MSVEGNVPVGEGRSRRIRGRSGFDGASVVLAVVAGLILAAPDVAHAYIGPGAGVTVLGALWAVIAAIALALGGLLLWPLRVMMRRRKRSAALKTAAAGKPDGAAGA